MTDRDVAIVGGGPAGCSAAVFCARYGLDTIVFDRGNSSLRQCGFLENYLGFPAGVDIDTFQDLIHDHAEEAGATIVPDMVETVRRVESTNGREPGPFRIELQDGDSVVADRVVAAARYDASFLSPLDVADEMFELLEHAGEEHENFDRDYPNPDGTTPIAGLYVAAPVTGGEAQAIMSAGHGARVGRALIADVRRDRGYPDALAEHWDWVRREATLDDEWADPDCWREWFDERVSDDAVASEDRLATLRERDVDRRLNAYLSPTEIDDRAERAQERLLEHVDDEAILAAAREIEEGDGAERPGE